jgi:hypothetical protein
MKTMMAAMILAALALAGCGSGNNAPGGNNAPANKPAGDGHGHGDEHTGTPHALGSVTLEGGITATVTQIGEPELGKDTVFEVKLEKNGKVVSDAAVTGWLGDEAGKELDAAGAGEWNGDEGMYDVHAHTPKTLPAKVMFWLKVVANDGTESKGSVGIHKH